MEYLVPANRVQLGDAESSPIDAAGKHVVIIGGGDTGADCLGTAHRQRATSVTQLEIMPRPDDLRPGYTPWPTWPLIYRTSSAHEEGGERLFAVNTERFVGDEDGNVRALALHEVQMADGRFSKIDGTEREIPADLVLLAMGFVSTGGTGGGLLDSLGVEVDSRGRAVRDAGWKSTADGVFIAGDAGRGQSLIVWAIAEGRAAAAAVDAYLSGSSALPAPIRPDTVALAAR
jgi:glutamate synthase (NADPH/NADH) small chain